MVMKTPVHTEPSDTSNIVSNISMKILILLPAVFLFFIHSACSENSGNTSDSGDEKNGAVVHGDSSAPEAIPAAASGRGVSGDTARGTIWGGESAGHQIIWGEDDITVGSGTTPFSLRAVMERHWQTEMNDTNDPEFFSGCTGENTVGILSVVGDIISYQRAEFIVCPKAAHPSIESWYQSFQASSPERKSSLTDFFEAADIHRALLADGIVQKTLAGGDITSPPATLPELIQALSEASSECEYGFSEDLLTRFAFHHLEGGKVAVRLGLSHGAGACRGNLTQLGILLPIPEKLAASLKKAEARTEGFLMRDQKKIANDKMTSIEFHQE